MKLRTLHGRCASAECHRHAPARALVFRIERAPRRLRDIGCPFCGEPLRSTSIPQLRADRAVLYLRAPEYPSLGRRDLRSRARGILLPRAATTAGALRAVQHQENTQ